MVPAMRGWWRHGVSCDECRGCTGEGGYGDVAVGCGYNSQDGGSWGCNVLDSCNQRSIKQCMKSGVAKHLVVAGIHQQNRLVEETNVTLFAKRCMCSTTDTRNAVTTTMANTGSIHQRNVLGMEIVRDQSGNTLRVS
nr:hypothetical protein [Tanacetum cinerariifolium]